MRISTDVRLADVITKDDQDVWLLLGEGWQKKNRKAKRKTDGRADKTEHVQFPLKEAPRIRPGEVAGTMEFALTEAGGRISSQCGS